MTVDPVELNDPRAPRVRRIRSLAGRSVRARQGRFLIEGPQGVRSLLTHRPDWVAQVFLTPQAGQRHPDIAALAHQVAPRETMVGTEKVLDAMSPDAQGVLAVARIVEDDAAGIFGAPLVAFLHQVRDPGNAGTVIRAADASGAAGVVLSAASVDLHNPKTVRSTAGSMFHLPVLTGADLATSAEQARRAGMQVLAADGEGQVGLDDLADAAAGQLVAGQPADVGAVDGVAARVGVANGVAARVGAGDGVAARVDLRRPTMWIFGNEAHGLTAAERATADAVVRIGIHGHAESLNLAMAATLCLFASARAQRSAEHPRPAERP